jgi:hypothetical protein
MKAYFSPSHYKTLCAETQGTNTILLPSVQGFHPGSWLGQVLLFSRHGIYHPGYQQGLESSLPAQGNPELGCVSGLSWFLCVV